MGSSTSNTSSLTGINGSTYSYLITSVDTAGNTNTSSCSSSISINTTPPANATSLGWVQTSPTNTTGVIASWIKSQSSVLSDQKIQFYSDSSCLAPFGSLIDLSSSSLQTRVLTGTNGGTYTYTITSIDTAGNLSTSSCSTALSINTTPPVNATSLGWVQTNPTRQTLVTATWNPSTSSVLSDQKIQFYQDATCAQTTGSLIDLNSFSIQTQSFTGINGSTYSFKITSIDTAGNLNTSSCSSPLSINTTLPAQATQLGWIQQNPTNLTSLTASWTLSASPAISDQFIQFFSDNTCTNNVGSLIDLSSASAQTNPFTGTNGGTYTYQITTFDTAGNSSTSNCSSAISINTTPPVNATQLSWVQTNPTNSTSVTASWTLSQSSVLADQKIQFYSDGSCVTTTGPLVDLSSATAQTNGFTASNGNTYTFKITSIDTAGNTNTSSCSSPLLVNTTPPANATSLGWMQTTPTHITSVTASWTLSTSTTLANQKIQFYSDGSCSTTEGSLIDLSSTTAQNQSFSGSNGNTYTFKITSTDTAGNTSISSCSSPLLINTTPPANATSLGWVQSNPTNVTAVTASWTLSTSTTLANQKIQFYSDGSCSTTAGSLIDLSSTTAQTNPFTTGNGNTYTFKITSLDTAGNTNTSSCSSPLTINTSPPASATSLGWIQSNPTNVTAVTASWTLSTAATLSDQKIQFYSDGSCTTSSGSLIDLSSNTLQNKLFTASNGNTYTYKIISLDTAGNSTLSSCSSPLTINTTPPANATSLSWQQTSPTNLTSVTATWIKSTAATLSDQKIQFYIDSSCTSATGSLIDLSSTTAQTKAFSASNSNTYTFKIISMDTAGNSSTSACSSALSINTTPPASATSLGWAQTSPTNLTSVTASWTKSSSSVPADQTIQFYSDGSCMTTQGSVIDLGSTDLANKIIHRN